MIKYLSWNALHQVDIFETLFHIRPIVTVLVKSSRYKKNNKMRTTIRRTVKTTYVEGSRRWANPCIFHAFWRRIPYNGHLVWPGPRADLRTRNSRSATKRSRLQSYEASSTISGRWAPAESSYTRAASAHTNQNLSSTILTTNIILVLLWAYLYFLLCNLY